uniref:Uncharacterized protein n=1 Tax=Aegilops tauschii subsp. strangulata TaxID=200361 RepID=A0A453BK28_AEGTS
MQRGGKHGPGHNIMFCFIRGLEDIYVSVVFTLIWACCAVMLFAYVTRLMLSSSDGAYLRWYVLLHLGVREIPEVHIMKRWTKNACENLPEHLMIYKACNSALKDATYRHSSLYSKALEIVQMGDKNTEAYGAAMKQLLDAISVLNDINQ